MKTILFAFLIFILSTQLLSQNITISGRIYGYSVTESKSTNRKIYYTSPGQPFNDTNYFTYNADYTYTWTLAWNEIKSEDLTQVVLSADPLANSGDPYGCFHTFYLDRIISVTAYNGQEDLILKSDLLFDMNCEMSMYYGAKEDQLERFIGNYQLIDGAITHSIMLEDFAYHCKSFYSVQDADFMNSELGFWSYNESTKQLKFSIWLKQNTSLGLMLKTSRSYTFTVTEDGNSMSFQSEKYTLTRLN